MRHISRKQSPKPPDVQKSKPSGPQKALAAEGGDGDVPFGTGEMEGVVCGEREGALELDRRKSIGCALDEKSEQ